MDAKTLAQLIDVSEYPMTVSKDLEREAKAAGLVIVFGASDDLMEFRGAIDAEIGAWGGAIAYLTNAGLLQNDCENADCPHFAKVKKSATIIDALWCAEGGYSWTYKTDIPHETFEIVEDGEPYCRGIVFALSDVT